jgi:endoglucanase
MRLFSNLNGSREILAAIVIFRFLFTAALPAQVFIDQVGYLPKAKKYALVVGAADSFRVMAAQSSEVLFRGPLSLWKTNDPSTGLTLYRGDFTAFDMPGEYVIRAGAFESYPFTIADSVYFETYQKSLKGFYFQRCGSDLLEVHAGEYAHSRCHIGDGFYHPSTDTSGFVLARGGWHDAGDYGKYVVNGGISVGTLLMAYEYFPAQFNQDDLNIPESGNGVPDILDEARFELEWFLTMQHPGGGVHHKLTAPQFEGFVMPQNHTGLRYLYEISSTATGNFAAVMARAARVYQPIDPGFAQTCLLAAQKAWEFLLANPFIVPFPDGFKNPDGTGTGEYGDGDDSDERMWAAAELFAATSDESYQTSFSLFVESLGLIDRVMSWPDVKTLAHLTFLLGAPASADQNLKDRIHNSLVNYCQELLRIRDASGFHVLIEPGEYYWGSNSIALNKAIVLILGYKLTKDQSYYNTALDQLHYILGVNAHNLSFVTGIGSKSPLHPHHRPSAADGVDAPVPGLLAGGPNQYLNDPELRARFDASTPPALTYVDDVDSYASNEIAINWNAPLVLAAGFFASFDIAAGVSDHKSEIPESFRLYQNYPNPFNPTTTIAFDLKRSGFTTLKVYDLLGRAITTLVEEPLAAGRHARVFEAAELASGIYFYELHAGEFRARRRMLLLR